MRSRHSQTTCNLLALFGLCGALLVAGCERPPPGGPDFRVQYPLPVEERVFALNVSVADADRTFGARDETTIRQFAREYMRRGRGPFLVARAEDDQAATQKSAARIAAVLMSEGVPKDRVYFQALAENGARSNLVHLSFSGYAIRLPECGDWSGENGFAPSNQPHTGFGCSYQRNLGLVLSNPGDLAVPREEAYGDAQRTDDVVRTYRSEKNAFGRSAPTLEKKDFSDVQ